MLTVNIVCGQCLHHMLDLNFKRSNNKRLAHNLNATLRRAQSMQGIGHRMRPRPNAQNYVNVLHMCIKMWWRPWKKRGMLMVTNADPPCTCGLIHVALLPDLDVRRGCGWASGSRIFLQSINLIYKCVEVLFSYKPELLALKRMQIHDVDSEVVAQVFVAIRWQYGSVMWTDTKPTLANEMPNTSLQRHLYESIQYVLKQLICLQALQRGRSAVIKNCQ